MKKKFSLICFMVLIYFLMFYLFLQNKTYSQEYGEEDYNWLYLDRILPLDSLPVNAYKDAVDYQWDLRQSEGFGLSPQVATWTNIGPSNEYRNGRVVRVKYDPTDQNVAYLCGHNGGVWRSDNVQANPSSNVKQT